jgi:hypothetical protein
VLGRPLVPPESKRIWIIFLTNAEGESSIEDIDIETIGKIQIIKGPNATGFGAGLESIIHS